MVNKYIVNPKTKGSGIVCAIPQEGTCPIGCADCFFTSGRSYLRPLEENLPNMPTLEEVGDCVVRVNDGNDSNNQQNLVIESTKHYPRRFYNTSIPTNLEKFREPVVLTINPHTMTDKSFHKLDPIPKNLMFVRVRVNSWNFNIVKKAVEYYTSRDIAVVLTFMAYYTETVPEDHKKHYIYKKRTLNSYNVIKTDIWKMIMKEFEYNALVSSCSKVEGEKAIRACRHCGNCLREYYACKIRLNNLNKLGIKNE